MGAGPRDGRGHPDLEGVAVVGSDGVEVKHHYHDVEVREWLIALGTVDPS